MTNHFDNSVSVIDTRKRAVTATIPVGTGPLDVAVTSDGKHVYTANDDGKTPSTVSDITTKTAAVNSIEGVGFASADAVTVRPGGAQAYAVGGNSIVTVIDTKTGTILQTPSGTPALPQYPNGIQLGSFNSEHIAFSPDGTRAYVTVNGNGTLVVIDTKARAVINTFEVAAGTYGVAITPDGKHAYVTTDNGFAVVDTTSGVVVTATALGPIPEQVAITPDGKYAYVTGGRGADTVSVINTKTRAVTDTIAAGSWPIGIAICSVQHARKH